jgi:hypothetical protein
MDQKEVELRIAVLLGQESVLMKVTDKWYVVGGFWKGWLKGVQSEIRCLEQARKTFVED